MDYKIKISIELNQLQFSKWQVGEDKCLPYSNRTEQNITDSVVSITRQQNPSTCLSPCLPAIALLWLLFCLTFSRAVPSFHFPLTSGSALDSDPLFYFLFSPPSFHSHALLPLYFTKIISQDKINSTQSNSAVWKIGHVIRDKLLIQPLKNLHVSYGPVLVRHLLAEIQLNNPRKQIKIKKIQRGSVSVFLGRRFQTTHDGIPYD